MTLVLGSLEPVEAPGTHAFIVGVGSYTYLNGGSEPRPAGSMGLGQLTSPPVSAKAFASWLLARYRNDAKPLRSLDLLLSPTQSYERPDGVQADVEPATMSGIQEAFRGWDKRCDQSEENVGIFYFCGHGLERHDLALLASDFGENEETLWDNAVNYSRTYSGMARNRARTQCFFVDTCRQVSQELLEDADFAPRTLKGFRFGHGNLRTAPELYATAHGRRAFGEENSVSRFTAALIDAFDGRGASKQAGGYWAVDTNSIGEAVIALIDRKNRSLERRERQSAKSGGETAGRALLHRLGNTPEVAATIWCAPRGELQPELYMEGRHSYHRDPEPGPWEPNVLAGVYDVGARFELEPAVSVSISEEIVTPPVYNITLECE